MRFYLDADLSPAIADLARDRFGLDIVSCHELGLRRAHDDAQLAEATREDRCVVTNNRDDFLRWNDRVRERGGSHRGILITTGTVPVNNFYVVARALAYYHYIYPESFIPNLVDWLHEAPPDWQPPRSDKR